MSDTKKKYDKKGLEYHQKRLNKQTALWNDCIDLPAIRKLAKEAVKGKRTLDLGCGSGILSKKIEGWGGKVVGVDFSSTLIKIAQQENPTIKFHVANATNLPFRSGEFSAVISALVAHYFKNLTPFFKEANRVLKKNGVFVFSMHHPVMETLHFSQGQKRSGKFIWKPYFHDKKYHWKMLDGMVLESYHHTFEAVFTSLSDAGFVVEKLLEPRPAKSCVGLNRDAYQLANFIPYFCTIRALKT